MDRRHFIKISGLSAAAVATTGIAGLKAGAAEVPVEKPTQRMKGHFSMCQITSATDTIGNSYLFKTRGGKVIMVDGGFESDADKLREKIAREGNIVDLWFISHPHQDHMEALATILADRRGMTIRKVIYSRCSDALLTAETWSERNALDAKRYYKVLDEVSEGTDIIDLHTTGGRFDIDGIGIKVLGVSNHELLTNSYNNSSMILRFWDNRKSVVLLGDAGIECGNKALETYPEWLDCDYLQMAHHGQQGCDRHFYESVKFKACLWPTPSWVWDPEPKNFSWIKTLETRKWIEEIGVSEHHVSCLEKDWVLE